ncbi:reverse transcriptase domain-containing protein [Tanacetum coccineum]
MAQTSSLQTQLTTTLGRIQTLEAREPVRTDDPKDVDSSAYFYFLVPSQDEASRGNKGGFQLERLAQKIPPKRTTTLMSDAAIKALVARSVADLLAEHEANRSRNRDDNHDSGTGSKRTERATRKCTYSNFLKCQPLNFKGTKGVVGLTQWFERMESVFHISNCIVGNQVKYTACSLLGNALMWWNSHVKTVGYGAAYGIPWKTLMKMMTDKYCLRGEIKKLEIEIWILKVKGTDVESYTQHFQELALLCGRMFSKVSNMVEKYVGKRPDMIQGSVMASKPNIIQDAIEFAIKLMD